MTGPLSADTFFGCPAGDFVGDVEIVSEDCIIAEGTTIVGDIEIVNGFLDVRGTVIGDIEQEGPADGNGQGEAVEVGLSGAVIGNISEKGPGEVFIDGMVTGNIKERDGGSVILFNVPTFEPPIFGTVYGNISEKGDGRVEVQSQLDGNIEEKDAGSVLVRDRGASFGATVNRDIEEGGDGGVGVGFFGGESGTVNGDIAEKDDGGVVIFSNGFVGGNVEEKDGGTVINAGVVTGTIESK